MSLLKQLLISVSLAILIILGGTLWFSVDSARSYLNTQLQAQTDSAATSLALTLSQPANQDPIMQELIVTAQFDSGQFARIVLSDPNNTPLFMRQSEIVGKSRTPNWFSRIFPVIMAESSAQVSDGWRQVGQVYLQADATYARDSLWSSFIHSVAWVLGAGVVWAVFVLFLMRWLRRVLHQEVALQLTNLTNQDASATLPAAPLKSTFAELQEVTQAIASARTNILATTDEQNAKIELLEVELNQDVVTGLVNRKYLVNELRRQLEKDQESEGWLLLFRQRDLAEINRVMARANVDEWLQSLSQQLADLLKTQNYQDQSVLARLNGSDFVILVSGLTTDAMQALSKSVQLILRQQRIQLPNGEFCRWAMAQTDYKTGQFLSHIFSRLDQALMHAESTGHSAVEILTSDQLNAQVAQPKRGETQWRTVIQDALVNNGFSLDLNQLQSKGRNWREATLLLHSTHTADETLSGYQFMPVATRLGLSGVCDLRTVELATRWLQSHPTDSLVIRVSLSSITQDNFNDQMAKQFVLAGPEVTKRLYIELDAFALTSEPVSVLEFAQVIHEYGVQFGIRRALALPRVLLDLKTYNARFIRISVQDVLEMVDKTGGEIMLRSILAICHQAHADVVLVGDTAAIPANTQLMLQEYGISL